MWTHWHWIILCPRMWSYWQNWYIQIWIPTIPNSEAIDAFGVPHSKAIFAKYVNLLAWTFEICDHFFRVLQKTANFHHIFTVLRKSKCLIYQNFLGRWLPTSIFLHKLLFGRFLVILQWDMAVTEIQIHNFVLLKPQPSPPNSTSLFIASSIFWCWPRNNWVCPFT